MSERGIGHFPVMADEMERHLFSETGGLPDGAFCDCTAGAGGYAERILRRGTGRALVAIDHDEAALAGCRRRLSEFGERVRYFQGGFSRIAEAVGGLAPLAGIVADLGLSRLQVDDPSRGFSWRSAGPLDMRFDRGQELRADDLVNRGGEREFADLLYRLADEHFSRRIARAVVRARPIRDTLHLAETVSAAVPKAARGRTHPATKTFQALRIAVNDELGELESLLEAAPGLLAAGGRFVAVSFHSGEDRLVKQSFRRLASAGGYELLTRRVERPSAAEIERNPPSRSARMRAVCRKRGELAAESRLDHKEKKAECVAAGSSAARPGVSSRLADVIASIAGGGAGGWVRDQAQVPQMLATAGGRSAGELE